jgi:hypothetical protein
METWRTKSLVRYFGICARVLYCWPRAPDLVRLRPRAGRVSDLPADDGVADVAVWVVLPAGLALFRFMGTSRTGCLPR